MHLFLYYKSDMNLYMKESVNEGCNSSSNRQPETRSETLIRPEEVAILLVVFGIWLYACGLFYARYSLVYCSFIAIICCRWKKFSKLETCNLYKAPLMPESQLNVQNSLDVSDGRYDTKHLGFLLNVMMLKYENFQARVTSL